MPVLIQPRRALVAEREEIIRQREAYDLGIKSGVVRTQELYESEPDRGISLRAALAEAAHREMQIREASLDRRQRSVRYRKRSPISGQSLQPASWACPRAGELSSAASYPVCDLPESAGQGVLRAPLRSGRAGPSPRH